MVLHLFLGNTFLETHQLHLLTHPMLDKMSFLNFQVITFYVINMHLYSPICFYFFYWLLEVELLAGIMFLFPIRHASVFAFMNVCFWQIQFLYSKNIFTELEVILLFWFFGGTGSWTQGFWIAKQTLHCLSHTSSPIVSFWR